MSVASNVIKLDQLKKDNISGNHVFLESTEQWVNAFSSEFDSNNFKELNHINGEHAKYTHTGLVYYFHLCWSQEVGACLRPDMLWFTIVSEIAYMVNKNPKDFRQLFTNTKEKQNINTRTNDVTDIDIDQLVEQLKNKVKNEEFVKLLTETTFESSVDGFQEAIISAFAYSAMPYFNYLTSMCGIPQLEIQGTVKDWKNLLDSVISLNDILGTQLDGRLDKSFSTYFENMIVTIDDIIKYNFHQPNSEEGNNFFNDIFHYGKNSICQSGHDHVIIRGWIKNFYLSNNGMDLYKYNKHLNCVPYQNIETKRQFCKFSGLTYSIYDETANTFYPQYGKVKYEITDRSTFKKLSKQ